MQRDAAERRQSPRHRVRDLAELASGQVLLNVRVDDISETGCGVVILNHTYKIEDQLGATGLLSFRPTRAGDPTVVLPVVLCDLRRVGSMLRYGLRFRQLTPRQSSRLATLMADLVPETADSQGPYGARDATSPAWNGPDRQPATISPG